MDLPDILQDILSEQTLTQQVENLIKLIAAKRGVHATVTVGTVRSEAITTTVYNPVAKSIVRIFHVSAEGHTGQVFISKLQNCVSRTLTKDHRLMTKNIHKKAREEKWWNSELSAELDIANETFRSKSSHPHHPNGTNKPANELYIDLDMTHLTVIRNALVRLYKRCHKANAEFSPETIEQNVLERHENHEARAAERFVQQTSSAQL